jgi:subtilase family serine protease
MNTFVRKLAAVIAVAALVTLLTAPSVVAAGGSAGSRWSHRDAHVCSQAAGDQAACTSIARVFYANGQEYLATTPAQLRAAARNAASVSYTAVGVRSAYGITGQGDPSRVIAIVDAYDDPGAFSHLTTYRSSMGLPSIQSCTLGTLAGLTSSASSPCFAKVNQSGGTTLPAANSGWSNEIDLDLQAASAVCPMCSLLLLEATSSSFSALGTAVTTASNTAHVLAISNSFGTTSDVSQASYPAWDNAAQKGIAVTAAAGDWGYATSFPASSTHVLGVGGTTLSVGSNGSRTAETAWSSTGSGCSTYNVAPSWQVIPNSPCGAMKAVSDVSADADPYSGLQIYTTYSGTTGWWIFGGTSLATPLISAFYAMQGGYGGSTLAGQHAWAPTTPYYDVTSGANGTCSPSVLCNSGQGWDGPTGLGSIATVTAPSVLTTITVSPASASVQTLQQQQFTATGYDQYGIALASQPQFSWSVDSAAGVITPSGLFTAGQTAGGPYTVSASSAGIQGIASVTVTAPSVLTTITVSPASASVQTSGTQQFSAIAYDQHGNTMSPQPTSFTWSASGDGGITSSGFFTAGPSAGSASVTASSGGVTSNTATVTVTAPAGGFALSASPSSRSIRHGQSTSYSIAIARTGGFTGSVGFTLTGQPSGVTGYFTPSSTTGTSSTLRITTSRSAATGSRTLTITGTAGALVRTVTVTLTLR